MEKIKIKFTDDELTNIKNIRSRWQNIIYSLGQLEVEKKILEEKGNELNKLYNEVKIDETAILNSLNTKYGQGTLDIENGEFVPVNS